ncbi:endonuclease/exonuclease/phosphatase family protein [Hyphococcus sp.]|jgi:endonuclease/exonuclease/phosphatase family metal-dependent hydrolase|uniref:endonuclease/exonuclease/phosphatase family protein n=1 Tax=Hyphococcus sp. TaxID=2038636 RepID=UPI003D0A6A85
MPYYNDLRPDSDLKKKGFALVFPEMRDAEKIRAIDNILALKNGLDNLIPPRRTDQTILIASWNIKEFGHTTQRLPEAYFYIAEIISRFDLVVIQEVKSTLRDLHILMRLLGSEWEYVVNDITSGDDGNSERSAYVFNSARVRLSGTVGELVLWPAITEGAAIKQLKRTPYLTGFKAGWKEFGLLCLHLQPGSKKADVDYRREEVSLLLAALREKMKEHWTSSLVIAGDFNFYRGDDKDDGAVGLFTEAGYYEVDSLIGLDTNASKSEAYDRMFIRQNEYFRVVKRPDGRMNGGVFDPFQFVYRDEQTQAYADEMVEDYTGEKDMTDPANQAPYYKHPWRKNQLSDHFPIWFELEIDSSVDFLENKREAFVEE